MFYLASHPDKKGALFHQGETHEGLIYLQSKLVSFRIKRFVQKMYHVVLSLVRERKCQEDLSGGSQRDFSETSKGYIWFLCENVTRRHQYSVDLSDTDGVQQAWAFFCRPVMLKWSSTHQPATSKSTFYVWIRHKGHMTNHWFVSKKDENVLQRASQ